MTRQAAPSVIVMKPFVGRGHVPAVREAADGTNEQVCTQPVVPAPAGTCPRPTLAVSCIVVRFSRVDCEGACARGSAAVRDEGALRMRRTPCGYAPYGELLLMA